MSADVIQVSAPGPVTLIDGRVVDSMSEEWRHECEARAVARSSGMSTSRSGAAPAAPKPRRRSRPWPRASA